jgi:hypothetical protein
MPLKITHRKNYIKINKTRLPFDDFPLNNIKLTIHPIRWVVVIISLFIAVAIITLILTAGDSYIKIILGYSIAGFFTFFMGYFGWIFAQSIAETIKGKTLKSEIAQPNFSFFLKNHKKQKF